MRVPCLFLFVVLVAAQACSSGESPLDSGLPADSGGPSDSGTTPDSGSSPDAGPPADAGADAGPPAFCTVLGAQVPDAGIDPSNDCLACQPALNATAWTQLADGSSCNGGTCASGVCALSTCQTCNSVTGLCAPLGPCTASAPCDDNGTSITLPDPVPTCKTANTSRPFYDDSPALTWTDAISELTRAACVFRPDAGAPLPLVVFFHGSTATADKVYDHTSLRGKATSFQLGAGSAGFVLASVEGRNIHWPDATVEGGHHEFYYRDLASPSTNPDFRAVDYLVDTLVSGGGIDRKRIYVTGWSNGAFFAQEYAIGRFTTATPGGNQVAAAAVYAGGDPFNNIKIGQTPSCQLGSYPTTQVPIFLVHRDCDAQVGCSGGQQTEFSIPPGMNVEGWLGTLTSTMGDSNVTDLMVSDAGAKLHESTGSPIGGSACAGGNATACPAAVGNANHQHWPDGVEDGSGTDWEPTMLGFLAAHPHP